MLPQARIAFADGLDHRETRMNPTPASDIENVASANPMRSQLDLSAIIQGRRSVRRYLDQPVPREQIEQVLAAAGWAPSPHGRQPWRFVVLTRDAPKRRL